MQRILTSCLKTPFPFLHPFSSTKPQPQPTFHQTLQQLHSPHAPSQTLALLTRLSTLKPSLQPYEDLQPLTKTLASLDIKKLSPTMLATLCALIPVACRDFHYNIGLWLKVLGEVRAVLGRDGAKLGDELLIDYMELGHELHRLDLLQQLGKLFTPRIATLDISLYPKYLQLTRKRKLPFKIEQQNFKAFVHKLTSQLPSLPFPTLFLLFRTIKVMNNHVYETKDLCLRVEGMIRGHVEEAVQRGRLGDLGGIGEVGGIVMGFRSGLNYFRELVLEAAIDLCLQNPKALPHLQTILQTLHPHEKPTLKSQTKQNLYILLTRNLDNPSLILSTLTKDILQNSQVHELVSAISTSPYRQLYEQNQLYLYEIFMRRAWGEQLGRVRGMGMGIGEGFGEREMRVGVVVSGLLYADPQNQQLKELRTKIGQILQQYLKSQKDPIGQLTKTSNKRLLATFSDRYKYSISQSLAKSAKTQPNTNTLITYLFTTRNILDTNKFFHLSTDVKVFHQFRAVLEWVVQDPSCFVRHFGFVNYVFRVVLPGFMESIANRKKIANYICNWQIHTLLTKPESTSFLNLTHTLIQKSTPKEISTDFTNYLVLSPARNVRHNRKFVAVLAALEGKHLEAQGGYFSVGLGLELMKLNAMGKKYAEMLVGRGIAHGVLRQYAGIVLGDSVELGELRITASTMILIVRSPTLTEQHLKPHLQTLLNLTNNLHCSQLETLLLNFSLPPNTLSLTLLETILENYIKKYNYYECWRTWFAFKKLKDGQYQGEKIREGVEKIDGLLVRYRISGRKRVEVDIADDQNGEQAEVEEVDEEEEQYK